MVNRDKLLNHKCGFTVQHHDSFIRGCDEEYRKGWQNSVRAEAGLFSKGTIVIDLPVEPFPALSKIANLGLLSIVRVESQNTKIKESRLYSASLLKSNSIFKNQTEVRTTAWPFSSKRYVCSPISVQSKIFSKLFIPHHIITLSWNLQTFKNRLRVVFDAARVPA